MARDAVEDAGTQPTTQWLSGDTRPRRRLRGRLQHRLCQQPRRRCVFSKSSHSCSVQTGAARSRVAVGAAGVAPLRLQVNTPGVSAGSGRGTSGAAGDAGLIPATPGTRSSPLGDRTHEPLATAAIWRALFSEASLAIRCTMPCSGRARVPRASSWQARAGGKPPGKGLRVTRAQPPPNLCAAARPGELGPARTMPPTRRPRRRDERCAPAPSVLPPTSAHSFRREELGGRQGTLRGFRLLRAPLGWRTVRSPSPGPWGGPVSFAAETPPCPSAEAQTCLRRGGRPAADTGFSSSLAVLSRLSRVEN